MGLSPEAADVLRRLQIASTQGPDLVADLDKLLTHATEAVPSCLGVSVTLLWRGAPVTLAALTPDPETRPVLSSLALHLPTPPGSVPLAAGAITLYAADTGAFTQMSADLVALLDLDPHQAMLDGHLDLPPDDASGAILEQQLDDLSSIDRALGVLLDRGLLFVEGQAELERLALADGSSVAAAARLVLAAVQRPPSASEP